MKRGFTIVEITVVVTVIAILSAVVLFAANKYQFRASDAQGRGLAAAVSAGAERYYRTNNEYPLASALFGGTPTGNPPASYTTASNILKVPTQQLDGNRADLVPCATTSTFCGTPNIAQVYYLTKTATDGTTARAYTIGTCTYTFPTTENGASSYAIAYYIRDTGVWNVVRSTNGIVTASDQTDTCNFKGF